MKPVIVGRIGAPFGIKGWVHVHSFTEPPDNLIRFSEWFLKLGDSWQPTEVLSVKAHTKDFVVHLKGYEDRERAEGLRNVDIAVGREALPPLPVGEYYWADLIGLEVWSDSGRYLGNIDSLFETGSNDVMVVQDLQEGSKTIEHLIPYILDEVVLEIDLKAQKMKVRWEWEL